MVVAYHLVNYLFETIFLPTKVQATKVIPTNLLKFFLDLGQILNHLLDSSTLSLFDWFYSPVEKNKNKLISPLSTYSSTYILYILIAVDNMLYICRQCGPFFPQFLCCYLLRICSSKICAVSFFFLLFFLRGWGMLVLQLWVWCWGMPK